MLGNLISVAALVLLSVSLQAAGHVPLLNRHTQLAPRSRGDLNVHKRFSATRWTFYDVGLGACGKHNVPSDFIVALNTAQFGQGYPGPNCFKTITLSVNGKTAQATIMDACPGCPYGGLDLSRGLFKFFASESVGVLSGDWWFGSSNGDGEDKFHHGEQQQQHHKPKPTKSHQAQPAIHVSIDGLIPTLKPSAKSKKVPLSSTATTPTPSSVNVKALSKTTAPSSAVIPSSTVPTPSPILKGDFMDLYQAFLGAGQLILEAGTLSKV